MAPVLIDDETPWVFHYQGLWGNDTADPLGGERGPAGPRTSAPAWCASRGGHRRLVRPLQSRAEPRGRRD